jgi:hypothetical protein
MDVHCDASLLLPCVHNLTISLLDISSWITFPAVDAGFIEIPPLPTIRVPRRFTYQDGPRSFACWPEGEREASPEFTRLRAPVVCKMSPLCGPGAVGTPRSRADGAVVWPRAISPGAPR